MRVNFLVSRFQLISTVLIPLVLLGACSDGGSSDENSAADTMPHVQDRAFASSLSAAERQAARPQAIDDETLTSYVHALNKLSFKEMSQIRQHWIASKPSSTPGSYPISLFDPDSLQLCSVVSDPKMAKGYRCEAEAPLVDPDYVSEDLIMKSKLDSGLLYRDGATAWQLTSVAATDFFAALSFLSASVSGEVADEIKTRVSDTDYSSSWFDRFHRLFTELNADLSVISHWVIVDDYLPLEALWGLSMENAWLDMHYADFYSNSRQKTEELYQLLFTLNGFATGPAYDFDSRIALLAGFQTDINAGFSTINEISQVSVYATDVEDSDTQLVDAVSIRGEYLQLDSEQYLVRRFQLDDDELELTVFYAKPGLFNYSVLDDNGEVLLQCLECDSFSYLQNNLLQIWQAISQADYSVTTGEAFIPIVADDDYLSTEKFFTQTLPEVFSADSNAFSAMSDWGSIYLSDAEARRTLSIDTAGVALSSWLQFSLSSQRALPVSVEGLDPEDNSDFIGVTLTTSQPSPDCVEPDLGPTLMVLSHKRSGLVLAVNTSQPDFSATVSALPSCGNYTP